MLCANALMAVTLIPSTCNDVSEAAECLFVARRFHASCNKAFLRRTSRPGERIHSKCRCVLLVAIVSTTRLSPKNLLRFVPRFSQSSLSARDFNAIAHVTSFGEARDDLLRRLSVIRSPKSRSELEAAFADFLWKNHAKTVSY